MGIEIKSIKIEKPEEVNVIIGRAHFIKTVEDLYEALAESSPSLKFGIAFNEASGKKLVRFDGNDEEMIKLAVKNAEKIKVGHMFLIFLKNGYPINVLNRIKQVSEVTSIVTASANPLEVIVADLGEARALLGVADGGKVVGIESEEDKRERKEFLRKIGYKR